MVSKASEDFPDPDRPVITTSWWRGISTVMFLRLCSRAPVTTIASAMSARLWERSPAMSRSAVASRSGDDVQDAIEVRQLQHLVYPRTDAGDRQIAATADHLDQGHD